MICHQNRQHLHRWYDRVIARPIDVLQCRKHIRALLMSLLQARARHQRSELTIPIKGLE